MGRVGFPWAEIAGDGSSVIGKHEGTGGEVSIGTVTSQLLYEIGGPEYFGPDVTTRFDTIQLEQAGTRPGAHVRHPGRAAARRRSRSASIDHGGFRNEMSVCLTGLDIEAKAALVEEAFWKACPFQPDDFRLQVTDPPHARRPARPRRPTSRPWRSWQDQRQGPGREEGRSRLLECGHRSSPSRAIPGFFGVGGGPSARAGPSASTCRRCVPAEIVPQEVVDARRRRRIGSPR